MVKYFMRIPSPEQAEVLIRDAEKTNPGPWVRHSLYVGRAAEAIAQHHPKLNPQIACIPAQRHPFGCR